ncbi:hypothetical protein QBC35DRAFT_470173 [Podospora australis]|uniref:Glycosyltransferase Family 31 n=1 Tax=Podospora australis TaxID=1536484 RepID=A0AAN6X2E0_9PEZI|nr:hypothetical protein QBC35DRAFT_470173 [Podospora australis]
MVPGRYFSKAAFLLLAVILILLLLTTFRLQDGAPPSPAMLQALAGEWFSHHSEEYGHLQPPPAEEDAPDVNITEEPSPPPPPPKPVEDEYKLGCEKDGLDFLRRPQLSLTDKIIYSRTCIKPVHPKEPNRDIVTNISQPLFTSQTTIDLAHDCSSSSSPLPSCETISLPVPPAYPQQQYPHLLFAVASTYDRINSSLPAFAHWLSHTGAHLLIVISDVDSLPTRYSLPALESAYRAHGILATVTHPKLSEPLPRKNQPDPSSAAVPVEQLHFMLIRDSLSSLPSSSSVKWISILDDDTFFPSLSPVSTALSSFNPSLPHYIGALSDNWESVKQWGYMAYGGAGIFLSVPLARSLDPFLEQCVKESTIVSGDGMLRDCIYSHTTTKLTLLPGLYQHDIRGDPSGFYESGVLPLSVHHWKSWYHSPVPQMAAVTKLCGDCFLQRFRFPSGKGMVLLANGYSITQYPTTTNVDLERMEGTWQYATDQNSGYEFTYGPMRPKLDENTQKKSWRLVEAAFSSPSPPPLDPEEERESQREREREKKRREKQTFRQVYVHYDRSKEVGNKDAMDEVVELIWEV